MPQLVLSGLAVCLGTAMARNTGRNKVAYSLDSRTNSLCHSQICRLHTWQTFKRHGSLNQVGWRTGHVLWRPQSTVTGVPFEEPFLGFRENS